MDDRIHGEGGKSSRARKDGRLQQSQSVELDEITSSKQYRSLASQANASSLIIGR